MGIRFYCSHCEEKLNVKVFQGGRQGLCPYCGGSIRIPTASTRPSSKEQPGHPSQPRPVRGAAGSAQRAQPLGDPPATATAPMAHSPSVTSATPAAPIAHANPVTPDDAVATSVPDEPAGPVGQTPVASSQPVAFPSPMESPPVPSKTLDPFDEAPDAVWYVRPPGGGQFGPAARDIMRGWIVHGRVTPDSLVWREGWPDWQEASSVFAHLGAQDAVPGLGGTGASETNSAGAADNGHCAPARRRPTAINVAVITVLALAIVALSVVLVWIVL